MKKLFLVLLTPFVLSAWPNPPWFKIVCPVAGWHDTTMTYTNLPADMGIYDPNTLSACMNGRVNSCGYWEGSLGKIERSVFEFHISEYSTTRINLRTKEVTNILDGESTTKQCRGQIY